MDEQNDEIVRVTTDDIGVPADVGWTACSWCADGGQDWALANGDRICDRCAALAREVGDGTLTVRECVEHPTSSQCRRARDEPDSAARSRFRFRSPLHLIVAVEHPGPQGRDAGGGPWLCGLPAGPADLAMAEDLGLFVDVLGGDERYGISGHDREDLLHNLAASVALSLACVYRDIHTGTAEDQQIYQKVLDDLQRHIAEVGTA